MASGRETESRRRLYDADLLPGRQVKRYHPLRRLFRLQLLLDLVRDLGGGGRPDPLQSEKLAASHRENFNGKDRAPLHSSSSSSFSSSGSCRRRTSAATEWSRVSESADSGRGLLILKWYAVWASREILCFARS